MKKEFCISLTLHITIFCTIYTWVFYRSNLFNIADGSNKNYFVEIVDTVRAARISGTVQKAEDPRSPKRPDQSGHFSSLREWQWRAKKDLPLFEQSHGANNGVVFVEDYMRWVVAHNKPPTYPRLARLRAQQGKVIVKVVVSSEGKLIQKATLEASSGSLLLDKLSLETIQSWNFPKFIGHDTQISFFIPIRFFMD